MAHSDEVLPVGEDDSGLTIINVRNTILVKKLT